MSSSQRAAFITAIAAALAATVVAVVCFTLMTMTNIRVALANDQTRIFDDMRRQAAAAEPAKAADYLDYAVGYYPSGTKQVAGSSLDAIVERARRNAVREIITNLRERTGQDYGDDPHAWIEALDSDD